MFTYESYLAENFTFHPLFERGKLLYPYAIKLTGLDREDIGTERERENLLDLEHTATFLEPAFGSSTICDSISSHCLEAYTAATPNPVALLSQLVELFSR